MDAGQDSEGKKIDTSNDTPRNTSEARKQDAGIYNPVEHKLRGSTFIIGGDKAGEENLRTWMQKARQGDKEAARELLAPLDITNNKGRDIQDIANTRTAATEGRDMMGILLTPFSIRSKMNIYSLMGLQAVIDLAEFNPETQMTLPEWKIYLIDKEKRIHTGPEIDLLQLSDGFFKDEFDLSKNEDGSLKLSIKGMEAYMPKEKPKVFTTT